MSRILIVGGCPRSGTTALARLLNCHPRVLVGDERYYWPFERGDIGPALFEPERFFDIREADRHWDEGRAPLPDGASRDRFENAAWVGDKYPPLWRAYGAIADRLPDARIVCIVRNPLSVAESYAARAADDADAWPFDAHRALTDWNQAVAGALGAIGAGADLTVVCYERLFAPGADLRVLFGALDLPAEPALEAGRAAAARAASVFQKEEARDEVLRHEVCLRADMAAYRRLADRCLYAPA